MYVGGSKRGHKFKTWLQSSYPLVDATSIYRCSILSDYTMLLSLVRIGRVSYMNFFDHISLTSRQIVRTLDGFGCFEAPKYHPITWYSWYVSL